MTGVEDFARPLPYAWLWRHKTRENHNDHQLAKLMWSGRRIRTRDFHFQGDNSTTESLPQKYGASGGSNHRHGDLSFPCSTDELQRQVFGDPERAPKP